MPAFCKEKKLIGVYAIISENILFSFTLQANWHAKIVTLFTHPYLLFVLFSVDCEASKGVCVVWPEKNRLSPDASAKDYIDRIMNNKSGRWGVKQ